MNDLASKVKAIIARRYALQTAQMISSGVMFKEISSLRETIKEALSDTRNASFSDHFNNTHLPLGQRVDSQAFGAIERLEDSLINGTDVSGDHLSADLGL